MAQFGELFIGMMSGTSMDGIDAALVAFDSNTSLRVLETEYTPFPDQLRAEISAIALNNSGLFCEQDSQLHSQLAGHYAQASLNLIRKAKIDKQDIRAIANHGQTVRHEPNAASPFSLQLGDPQIIANRSGIPVIARFRQADLAAGGQGAPLMPAFHAALFGQISPSFVLNLGGIANLTYLSDPVIGFDTGTSNALMDLWIGRHRGLKYDSGGRWAAGGQVESEVLERLMRTPYLHKPYPKSTGTDYFNLDWLQDTVPELHQYDPQNIQATLLAFTVDSIKLALTQLGQTQGTIFVCGGGAHNTYLIEQLTTRLKGFEIKTTDSLGIPADWVEAAGFAWLGYCYLHNLPSNLPSVTGAARQVVLGEYFAPQTTA